MPTTAPPRTTPVALAALGLLLTLLGPASAARPTVAAPTAPLTPTATREAAGAVLPVVAGAARRARIKVRVPASVEPAGRFAVRGRVGAGKGRRLVVLTERRGKRWRRVGRDRTTRRGTYRIRVRAGATEQVRRFRLQARSGGRVVATSRFEVSVAVPRPPTRVVVTWPATVVPLGTPLTVTGTVDAVDPAGRTASLQLELPSGWRDVASVPVDPDGTFALAAPGDWLRSLPVRVLVPASTVSAEGVSARSHLEVTPTWTPPGSADDWTELGADVPLRHDPCRVVRYRTNLDRAPAGAAAAIPEALRQVSLATGLRFEHLGGTAALFDGEGPHAAYPSDVTLVVGFGTAAQTRAPFDGAGGTVGWGGSSAGRRARSAVLGPVWRIVQGGAVLKADHPWQPAALLEALVHEVGHAVGLGHARSREQVMYPVSEGDNPVWGAGDLAGLGSAGLQSGCLGPVHGSGNRSGDEEPFPDVVALP